MTVALPSRLVSPPPGAVPREAAVLKLWGDDISGRVNDWIYVSSDKIQQMVFSLAPGGSFGHSRDHRTNLGADEFYFVLSGTLVLANPQTGEVHRLGKGEAIRFGPDTWHHGFSYGRETLRVLEYFAPPPATGSSQLYARTKPYLDTPTYVQNEWIGRWPETAKEARARHTQHVISADDILWRLEGKEHQVLVGILLSTDELTAGRIELLPGQRSDIRIHGGDLTGYVLGGRLNLLLPESPGPGPGNGWFQMSEDDGFFVPASVPYRYYNMTAEPVQLLFGVAPTYLPGHD